MTASDDGARAAMAVRSASNGCLAARSATSPVTCDLVMVTGSVDPAAWVEAWTPGAEAGTQSVSKSGRTALARISPVAADRSAPLPLAGRLRPGGPARMASPVVPMIGVTSARSTAPSGAYMQNL